MSTEARDKALAAQGDWARPATFIDEYRSKSHAYADGYLNGFNAAWDARGQVTPEREAIAKALRDYNDSAPSGPFNIEDDYLDQADSILALFNESATEDETHRAYLVSEGLDDEEIAMIMRTRSLK